MKKKLWGDGKRCFVIAEISANHGQNYQRAATMVRKAKACGADAVKFQLYTPDTLTIDTKTKYFRIKHPQWGGQTLYELYQKSFTPWDWFPKLKKIADEIGLIFFATAFDKSAVDFLEELKVGIHKIASFELVDLPLIQYAAGTRKPLIVSTGMANLGEIKDAVRTARSAGVKDLALLKCVSSYPASPADMNLTTMADMARRFKCPVGLSDHTLGTAVSTAAVALGARIIEKHFTLSRKIKTADSFFSLEPQELKELVDNIRLVEKATGTVSYGLTRKEKTSRVFRRSLFVVEDVKRGEVFSSGNVRSIRPAGGMMPKHFKKVLGRKASRDIRRGTPLKSNMISGSDHKS